MEFGKSVSRTILAGAFAALCWIYSLAAQAAEKTAELDLQAQIDAAAARGGGTVRVPAGVYEVKPFVLKSNTTLEFAEGAMLLASTNLADYSEIPEKRCVIYAENATNVAVVGKGVVNGRGGVFKAGLYSIDRAYYFGHATGATADGRLAKHAGSAGRIYRLFGVCKGAACQGQGRTALTGGTVGA